MIITVNGTPQEVAVGATIGSLIETLPAAPEGRGVAVAVEGEVIPRGAWPRTELAEGSHVEVVVAVQGG